MFKKIVFALLTIPILYAGVELVAYAFYFAVEGKAFSFEDVSRKRALIADIEAPDARDSKDDGGEKGRTRVWGWHVIHPYLGFVWDPADRPESVNGWILTDDGSDPLVPSAPDDDPLDVVLLGGSVAHMLFTDAAPLLRARLEATPGAGGRRVRVVSLAMPGFKQPQQLLSATYYLSLGGAADWIVNLDGFNEVGLELFLTNELGMYPAFPRIWESLVSDFEREETRDTIEDVAALSRLRRLAAELFERVGFSVTANVVWKATDEAIRSRLDAARSQLVELKADLDRRRILGFDGTQEEALALSYDIWLRSSRALRALAEGHGLRYFHFLQPNQYVPDSKPLTREERRLVAFNYLKRVIPQWYPRLVEGGRTLREQGVRFHDLSRVYAGVEETLYDDPCCHVNERGNELMAEAMARAIAEGLSNAP